MRKPRPSIYSCQVSICALPKRPDEYPDPNKFSPSLAFCKRTPGGGEVALCTIRFAMNGPRDRSDSRWMVTLPDFGSDFSHCDFDEGLQTPLYGRGESVPRDSTIDAIKHALSVLEDHVTAVERDNLYQTAKTLVPTLESCVKALETLYRSRSMAA